MSSTTVYKRFYVNDALADATTAKLSDVTAAYGVKRNDTDAVVVADDTAMVHDGTGLYHYTFTDPAADLVYTYAVEFVYGGETFRETGTLAGGAALNECITLEEARTQLHLDGTEHDAWLTMAIPAVCRWGEKWQRRSYLTQTRTLRLDSWRGCYGRNRIELPYPPLQSVTSITYVDLDGVTQTVDSAVYQVHTWPFVGYVAPAYLQWWPNHRGDESGITITYVAGYGAASAVPAEIKHGLLLLLGHWFENREGVEVGTLPPAEFPLAIRACLGLDRAYNF